MTGFSDRRARFIKTLAATASALCLASGAAAEPDEARIELESGTASALVGWYWAQGTLITDQARTPFCLEGPTFGQVGGARGVAVGRVRHLDQLSDLPGRYAVAEAGGAFARGSRAVAMRNDKGVVITLISDDEGLMMGLGGRALRLRVDCWAESSSRRGASLNERRLRHPRESVSTRRMMSAAETPSASLSANNSIQHGRGGQVGARNLKSTIGSRARRPAHVAASAEGLLQAVQGHRHSPR